MCSVLAVDGEFDERSAQPPARGAGWGAASSVSVRPCTKVATR
jgi:hypothetical protein